MFISLISDTEKSRPRARHDVGHRYNGSEWVRWKQLYKPSIEKTTKEIFVGKTHANSYFKETVVDSF